MGPGVGGFLATAEAQLSLAEQNQSVNNLTSSYEVPKNTIGDRRMDILVVRIYIDWRQVPKAEVAVDGGTLLRILREACRRTTLKLQLQKDCL